VVLPCCLVFFFVSFCFFGFVRFSFFLLCRVLFLSAGLLILITFSGGFAAKGEVDFFFFFFYVFLRRVDAAFVLPRFFDLLIGVLADLVFFFAPVFLVAPGLVGRLENCPRLFTFFFSWFGVLPARLVFNPFVLPLWGTRRGDPFPFAFFPVPLPKRHSRNLAASPQVLGVAPCCGPCRFVSSFPFVLVRLLGFSFSPQPPQKAGGFCLSLDHPIYPNFGPFFLFSPVICSESVFSFCPPMRSVFDENSLFFFFCVSLLFSLPFLLESKVFLPHFFPHP